MCSKLVNFLPRKIYDWDNFTPTLCQRLLCQSMTVGIGLNELTEFSDTLNYKAFFKHFILQTIFIYFSSFTLGVVFGVTVV